MNLDWDEHVANDCVVNEDEGKDGEQASPNTGGDGTGDWRDS